MNSVRTLPLSIKKMAIAHLIGQMQDLNLPVKTSDIAHWLGCTKQTAQKYLLDAEQCGLLQRRVENWRGEANVWYWKLTNGARQVYKMKVYEVSFQTIVDIKVGE